MKSPHKSEVEMASPIATADNETKLHSDGGPSDKSSKNSKPAVRTGELENEQHVIPQNRLIVVFIGLMLATFLAALDQTIVSTAVPTIVHDLGGGSDYSWIGSSYVLASAAFTPLYGRATDLIGRKPILFGTIVLFLIGSALCGAAQSLIWLILARALQGVGGGGILGVTLMVISDIVSLEKRPKYSGFISSTWALATVVGPLMGGAFVQHLSWRWCFFINLPVGGFAILVLVVFLKLNPVEPVKISEVAQTFDWIGLGFLVPGVVLFLTGLASGGNGQYAWTSGVVLGTLIPGILCLLAGVTNEIYTKRIQLLPRRLFKTRTTASLLFMIFLHGFVFTTGIYYMPLYFQSVEGSSAMMSGVDLLPASATAGVTAVITGIIVAVTGDYSWCLWIGWIFLLLGNGLFIDVTYPYNAVKCNIFLFIAGIGIGGLFVPPLIALQAAMPTRDRAVAMGSLVLFRLLGSAVGMAVGGTILNNQLATRLASEPQYILNNLTIPFQALQYITPTALKDFVLNAYALSFRDIWITNLPLCALGLCSCVLVRKYTLKRNVVEAGTSNQDIESKIEPPTESEASSTV